MHRLFKYVLHPHNQSLSIDLYESLVDMKIVRLLKPLKEFLFLSLLLKVWASPTSGTLFSLLRVLSPIPIGEAS
jgi:hypothetical protein